MKKILLLLIFHFSLFIFHSNAQQYWHRVKGGCGQAGAGDAVISLVVDSTNNLLYAGGNFNTIDNSIGCDAIGSWDGNNWSTNTSFNSNPSTKRIIFFQNMLFISSSTQNDGGIFYNTGGSNWQNLANMNSQVQCLCIYHNKLYVGGDFTTVNGMSASFIACYDGTNWNTLGSGIWCTQFPGHVTAMCVWNDKLIAGGSFDKAGGLTVHSVAAWNDTTWSDVGWGVVDSGATNVADVYALCVHDSDLIVGGTISHADGLPVNNICRFNGSNWFALGAGVDANVYSLLSFKGKLNVGGEFEIAGGISASRFAYWNDTTWATTYGGGVFNSVFAMAVYDSVLYIGGLFGYIGNVNCNHIAALYDYPDSSVSINEVESSVESDASILCYPNPSEDKFNIEVKNIQMDCEAILSITDLLGKKLLEKSISLSKGNSNIDIKHQLPDGIYLVSLVTTQARLHSTIVVQKQ